MFLEVVHMTRIFRQKPWRTFDGKILEGYLWKSRGHMTDMKRNKKTLWIQNLNQLTNFTLCCWTIPKHIKTMCHAWTKWHCGVQFHSSVDINWTVHPAPVYSRIWSILTLSIWQKQSTPSNSFEWRSKWESTSRDVTNQWCTDSYGRAFLLAVWSRADARTHSQKRCHAEELLSVCAYRQESKQTGTYTNMMMNQFYAGSTVVFSGLTSNESVTPVGLLLQSGYGQVGSKIKLI